MLTKLKNFFWSFYIKSSPNKYDDKHKGTFSVWRVFTLNLMRPGRILKRLQYKQIFRNKKNILNNFEKKINNIKLEKEIDSNKFELVKSKLANLVDDGVAVIPDYFDISTIDTFKTKYKETIDKTKNFDSQIPSYSTNNLPLSNDLNLLWLDNVLINLISAYFNHAVYARNYPELNYTNVPQKKLSHNGSDEKRASDKWHVDHAVLFNIHILLEDVDKDGTCMEVMPRTQKLFNYASNYSENVIKDLKRESVKCFGKRGTVYMHTGNVIHRLRAVEGSNRLNLHFEFSPGTNILLDVNKITKCLSSGFNLEKLSHQNRDILKAIFPKTLLKGYDVKKESLNPNTFQGI